MPRERTRSSSAAPSLPDKPRHLGVLELAAEKAGWGTPLPERHGRGIAVHESYGSFVAIVVEASVDRQGKVRVHRVVSAVDCGMYVNPDTIAAQMESGASSAYPPRCTVRSP